MHSQKQQEADGQQKEQGWLVADAEALGRPVQDAGCRSGDGQRRPYRQPKNRVLGLEDLKADKAHHNQQCTQGQEAH